MRRSPSETWMFSVVFWILCSWLSCLADWQVSCSRYVVQLQQTICHQNDCEHEWQSTFSPKKTRGSEQSEVCQKFVCGPIQVQAKFNNLKYLVIVLLNVQILELITVTCDRWMKLGCGSWQSMVFSCWIALTPTMHLLLSLVRSDVSRGHRENTSSTLYIDVTVTISCLSFWLGEASMTSTISSKFSPKSRHTWCHCWWLMEVRHSVSVSRNLFVICG